MSPRLGAGHRWNSPFYHAANLSKTLLRRIPYIIEIICTPMYLHNHAPSTDANYPIAGLVCEGRNIEDFARGRHRAHRPKSH